MIDKTFPTCLLLSLIIKPSSVQFAMPMYPPQPQQMYPMPQPMMGPPPGMMAMAPMPAPIIVMAMDMNSKEQVTETTTSTTTTTTTCPTTTERNMAVAIPVPVPLPVQVAIPAFPPPSFCYNQPRPKNCPPCPPCQCQPTCTPSFFAYCSPCHLKCRCRNGDSIPAPLPPMAPQPIPGPAFPIPAPIPPYNPSVMIVPYPPVLRQQYRPSCSESSKERTSASCSEESSKARSASSCEMESGSRDYRKHGAKRNRETRHHNDRHSKEKRHHKEKHSRENRHHREKNSGEYRHHKEKHSGEKKHHSRNKRRHHKPIARNFNNFHFGPRRTYSSENELVKPMLSYVAADGEIMLQKRISNADAATLMGQKKDVQNIQIMTGDNKKGQSKVLMISSDYNQNENSRRHRQIVLGNQMEPEILEKGKKEIIFKPPEDKKITNLSLSFQII